MPFELRIRQTGLFRKKLEIEDIASGIFRVGMHDRFLRFTPMIPSEGFLIIYDPAHIGTGIRMRYSEEETEEAFMSLPGITTMDDIAAALCICREIMKKWQTRTVEFEDVSYEADQLDGLRDLLISKTMKNLAAARANYDEDITLVHGALWPLTFETEKLQRYGNENDAEGFAALLHECQNREYYWCATHVFLSDDQSGYQGVLSIMCGINTIIPLKPMPPVDMTDPLTGDQIICSRYTARIVEGPSRRPLLQMEYHKFLQLIRADSLPLYDACHVVYKADAETILNEAEKREEMEGKPCW